MGVILGLFISCILVVILYRAIYPEFSQLKRRCNQVEVGMSKNQVIQIFEKFITPRSEYLVGENKYIGIIDGIVSCRAEFDNNWVVKEILFAVDGF